MKTQTIIADIRKFVALKKAEVEHKFAAEIAKMRTASYVNGESTVEPSQYIAEAAFAFQELVTVKTAFGKLPRARRDYAARAVKIAEGFGTRAARMGDLYSGETEFVVRWWDDVTASTSTSRGDQYSHRCKYSKTDACHSVTLAPEGIVALVENEALANVSARDGLHLIALHDNGAAVWVRKVGKAIQAEKGWIAGNDSVCYHSTKSADHARAGFARKLAILEKEQAEQAKWDKENRRARLVARLCAGVTATVEDARALGFCSPGISAFQQRHGIGNSATLPQLIRTGNPSAVRLALAVARKVKAKTKTKAAV